jgi:hypothetical protein
MSKLNEKEVEYTLTLEPEYMEVRGNAMASGDDAEDRKVEDAILRELEWNPWAWCCMKVTASWRRIEGVDYLGGCSYKDEKEFKQPGGYWDDMKAQALEDLKRNILDLRAKVCGVEVSI